MSARRARSLSRGARWFERVLRDAADGDRGLHRRRRRGGWGPSVGTCPAWRPRGHPRIRSKARLQAARRGRPARSEERRVGKRVDLGGRRIIKKKKKKKRICRNEVRMRQRVVL